MRPPVRVSSLSRSRRVTRVRFGSRFGAPGFIQGFRSTCGFESQKFKECVQFCAGKQDWEQEVRTSEGKMEISEPDEIKEILGDADHSGTHPPA